MRIGLAAFSILAVFTLVGCVVLERQHYPTPPPALSLEASAIGIVITERKQETVLHPNVVYFARVDDIEGLFSQSTLIVSAFSRQGRNYLLNVPPGRYVAVASGRPGLGSARKPAELTFFPKEMIRQTETVVTPGEIKSMGTFEISYPLFGSVLHNQNDSAQKHYFHLILPDTSIGMWSAFWRFWLFGQRELSASNWKTDHSIQVERIFLDMADADLKGRDKSESWSPMIQHRVEALAKTQ